MKTAILGFAQSGRKTLFSLLTGRPVPESLRPGETLEGRAIVRDPRVDELSRICRPDRTTYAENRLVLCPAVTPGGRDWPAAARRCDVLCLVVRAFDSDSVYHPEGSVDPERDLARLRTELILADMEIVETRLRNLEKEARAGQTPAQALKTTALRKCLAVLESERPLRQVDLAEPEEAAVRSLELLTRLPEQVIYNVAENDLDGDRPEGILPVACEIEREIMAIDDPEERRAFLEDLGLSVSGVDRVNAAIYEAQGLMSFYTVGPDEVRAWTIRRGSPAPVAGGRIHSDIRRGFIRVEIVKYDDFVSVGSETAARNAGRMSLRGRDYVLEDGDICRFLFNV